MSGGGAGCGVAGGGREAKAAPVLGGADTECPQERPAHRLRRAEAAARRHRGQRLAGVLQGAPRRLQTQALDVAGRCDPRLGAEAAGEVAGAHVCPLRQRLHGEVGRQALHGEALDVAQRVALGRLGGEGGAELRLVGRSAQEEDEVTGDRQRRLPAQVVLDEGEREVHPGGHPGGGPDVTVADEDRLGVDADAGVATGELGRRDPVSRCAAVVEQTGGGEGEGPGADGGDAAGAAGAGGDPVEHGAVAAERLAAGAAGDQEGVDPRGDLFHGAVGQQGEAAGGPHGLTVGRDDLNAVGGAASRSTGPRRRAVRSGRPGEQLVGAGEDLEWAGDVEALDAGVDEDRDLAGTLSRLVGHRASIVTDPGPVRKDGFPTISAMSVTASGFHDSARGASRGGAYRLGCRMYEEAPDRVAQIVDAAERTAATLREQAEARARERIAEADRAAESRVRAAEEEAQEILRDARTRAEAMRNDALSSAGDAATEVLARAHSEAERVRKEAQTQAHRVASETQAHAEALLEEARAEARELEGEARRQAEAVTSTIREEADRERNEGREDAARLRLEAQERANEIRARARSEVREILGDAHAAAAEVLREGTTVSRNLRDLSASLRSNAERLLRDVRLTHGSMTARLDQAGARDAGGREPAQRAAGRVRQAGLELGDDGDDGLEVPEFVPRG